MLTWNDINSNTNPFIVPRVVDNVYKAAPTLIRFRSQNAEKFEGGEYIS